MTSEYRDLSRRIEQEAPGYAVGARLMASFAAELEKQDLLPKRLPKTIGTVAIRLEALNLREAFSEEERKALVDDGAMIYLPTGETIKAQKSARRPFWFVADGYKEDGKNRLTEFPSRRIEVAIYPNPERFFVPDTFSKTTDQQITLVEQDANSLRERLGLPNIGEILPEASEVTEVLFKHFDATKVRLLGQDYMRDGYWSYIRTSTPTNKEGSNVADVGGWGAGNGLDVFDWGRSDIGVHIGAARWVVPTGTR